METLAFTHVAVNYEDPNEAPSLREFDLEPVKKAVVFGVAGSAAALAMTVAAPEAHAVLQQGDKCFAVELLQEELYFEGFLAANDVDGIFGPKTYNAVRDYQIANGLGVDGKAGPETGGSLGLGNPSCGQPDGTENSSSSMTGIVTAKSGVNVRLRKSTSSPIMATLANGETILLAGKADENGWTETRSGWWVASRYIRR